MSSPSFNARPPYSPSLWPVSPSPFDDPLNGQLEAQQARPFMDEQETFDSPLPREESPSFMKEFPNPDSALVESDFRFLSLPELPPLPPDNNDLDQDNPTNGFIPVSASSSSAPGAPTANFNGPYSSSSSSHSASVMQSSSSSSSAVSSSQNQLPNETTDPLPLPLFYGGHPSASDFLTPPSQAASSSSSSSASSSSSSYQAFAHPHAAPTSSASSSSSSWHSAPVTQSTASSSQNQLPYVTPALLPPPPIPAYTLLSKFSIPPYSNSSFTPAALPTPSQAHSSSSSSSASISNISHLTEQEKKIIQLLLTPRYPLCKEIIRLFSDCAQLLSPDGKRAITPTIRKLIAAFLIAEQPALLAKTFFAWIREPSNLQSINQRHTQKNFLKKLRCKLLELGISSWNQVSRMNACEPHSLIATVSFAIQTTCGLERLSIVKQIVLSKYLQSIVPQYIQKFFEEPLEAENGTPLVSQASSSSSSSSSSASSLPKYQPLSASSSQRVSATAQQVLPHSAAPYRPSAAAPALMPTVNFPFTPALMPMPLDFYSTLPPSACPPFGGFPSAAVPMPSGPYRALPAPSAPIAPALPSNHSPSPAPSSDIPLSVASHPSGHRKRERSAAGLSPEAAGAPPRKKEDITKRIEESIGPRIAFVEKLLSRHGLENLTKTQRSILLKFVAGFLVKPSQPLNDETLNAIWTIINDWGDSEKDPTHFLKNQCAHLCKLVPFPRSFTKGGLLATVIQNYEPSDIFADTSIDCIKRMIENSPNLELFLNNKEKITRELFKKAMGDYRSNRPNTAY